MSISHQIYNINGYKLLLLKNNIDNITVKSYIDTGYIDENSDNLGINHLLEHVLINGDSKCNHDCITYMNKKGILMNASTGLNIINYYNSGIKSDLEKMIKFIIEITINYKNINNKVIEKEKKAVLNELLTNSNNNLINIYNLLYNKLFIPYGLMNFFNYKKQINNLNHLDEEKLKNFYLKYYKNILFVVSGNFTTSIVLNLFENSLKSNKIDYFKDEQKINNCFKLEKGAYFLHSNNVQNTVMLIGFPSIIENSIKNNLLLSITITYIKNVCMDILRAKNNLIYGIDIIHTINDYGTIIKVKAIVVMLQVLREKKEIHAIQLVQLIAALDMGKHNKTIKT